MFKTLTLQVVHGFPVRVVAIVAFADVLPVEVANRQLRGEDLIDVGIGVTAERAIG